MIRITHHTKELSGEINLPSTKSISNRMLMLQKLYEPDLDLQNISEANDSVILQKLLANDEPREIDVQDAGSVFRFMVAYCACTPGEWIVTGSARLQQRPIAQLVDALRLFGADIECLGTPNFAPLRIRGKQLRATTNLVDVSASKSSQFVTALLLIAPKIEGQFNLIVNPKMPSYSYIQLTISCLRRMGYSVWKKGKYLEVGKTQKFDGEYFEIEPDWTSFYYWYSAILLSEKADLFFPGLRLDNMQKERKLLFEVGNTFVQFEEVNEGIRITKKPGGKVDLPVQMNFSQFPDSAMTFGMLLPALGHQNFEFRGLESLQYKECNREQALSAHLQKVGVGMRKDDKIWFVDASGFKLKPDTLFETYEDHRMAMCVAPLAMLEPVRVEEEQWVRKSYPHFWDDLKSVGFEIDYL